LSVKDITLTTLDPNTNAPRRFNLNRQKQYDYDKKMQDLIGRVAVDGSYTTPTGDKIEFDGQERNLIKSGQWQGVSQEKVRRLVEALIPAYKESQEGQQDYEKMTKLDGLKDEIISIPDGKGVRKTSAIDEDIRRRFNAIANPQVGTTHVQRWDDFGETEASKAKKALADLVVDGSAGSVTDNNVAAPVPTEANDPYTEKISNHLTGQEEHVQWRDRATGRIVPKEEVSAFATGNVGIGGKGGDISTKYDKVVVDPAVVNAQKSKLYERSNFQGYNFKDKAHFEESLASANENMKKTTAVGFEIQPEQKEQYNKTINAGLHRSKIIAPDGKVLNLKGLADSWGVSPADIEVEADQMFYESPNSNIPPGYVEVKVNIKGNKNADKSGIQGVFVPVGNAFTAVSAPVDHLFKASLFKGDDIYDGSIKDGEVNAYYPKTGKGPIKTKDGGTRGFYTSTALLPKEEQVPGEYPYRTIVYPVTHYEDGKGNSRTQPILGEDGQPVGMSIEEWKAFMHKDVLGTELFNVIKSGKTDAPNDVKNHNPYNQ
jgi:hypothetical protein